jgi:hypothetical protein
MKMNCKKFNDLIPSYHDGRLTARERTEFEHHKHACPECAGLLQDTVTIADVLKSTAEPVPLPDWDKSWRVIAATLTPRPDRKWRLALVPRWALVASGFLLFFILGIASARFFFSPSTLETVAPSDAPFLYSAQADQTRVRQLLGDLYLLKLRAEKSRDASLQHLLGDIELVLLEIAHVDRSDPDQVRQVGAMIQEKGISLKMKVYRFEGRKSVRI